MLRIVEWRGVYRILDDANIIVAVCESRDEAEAYITAVEDIDGSRSG